MIHDSQKGVGLVELVIVISIVSASFFALMQVSLISLNAATAKNNKVKALLIAQEGIEAVRNIRDASWADNIASLTFGMTYYLDVSGTKWILTTTSPGVIDSKFTRIIVLDNVSRDINDNIVITGGTNDSGTKKLTVTVSWPTGATNTQIVTYITNL